MSVKTYKVEFCYGYYIEADTEQDAKNQAAVHHNSRIGTTDQIPTSPALLADGVHVEQDLDEYEQLEYDVTRCDDCDENHLCSEHAARRGDL